MELYLDANATTPVLPAARAAALAAMDEEFGNPSSVHSTGLRARALVDAVRQRAQRVLGAGAGRLLFVSGATEGIQTAVLSALTALRQGDGRARWLLYGATEHKAVPEALAHWNRVLGLDLELRAIPVGRDGRHDLDWLRAHAPQAGLVCTMAANNETGVVSDLDGIAAVLADSPALWLVDSVQALGKLPLDLAARRIDYAPFSGHKLYAPKGIGLLYVRDGAPFTPLMAGGGQEGGWRSGTENMAGIAALGAVLAALEEGGTFADAATLARWRARLAGALAQAFPGLQYNAPAALCLPTTLNFSVPGLPSQLLRDVFDAAGLRVSGGSACSSAKAQPSHVLLAMGLPPAQAAEAVRLSFGPATDEAVIDAACIAIGACGEALRASGLHPAATAVAPAVDGLQRLAADGACCHLLVDAARRQAVVFDPRPAHLDRLLMQLPQQGLALAAVLDTRGDAPEAAAALRAALPAPVSAGDAGAAVDGQGWPLGADALQVGAWRVTPLALPGDGGRAYRLQEAGVARDRIVVAALPLSPAAAAMVGPEALLLPAQDPDDWIAGSAAGAELTGPAPELDAAALDALRRDGRGLLLVDVREAHEQCLSPALPVSGDAASTLALPLSRLAQWLPEALAWPAQTPLVFVCRSGRRSALAAQALRRLGRAHSYSLAGGLALWPRAA